MATIYIDFERDNRSKTIEVGAICVFNKRLESQFHHFIHQPIINHHHYLVCAQNSHCISPKVVNDYGYEESIAKQRFYQWINSQSHSKLIIKGYGQDTSQEALQQWIPELKTFSHLIYEQVELPNWEERQYGDYHIATQLMKNNCQLCYCKATKHKLPMVPTWKIKKKTPTHSKMARLMYGFHCSLFDSFELAFYEKTLSNYCCDEHFFSLSRIPLS